MIWFLTTTLLCRPSSLAALLRRALPLALRCLLRALVTAAACHRCQSRRAVSYRAARRCRSHPPRALPYRCVARHHRAAPRHASARCESPSRRAHYHSSRAAPRLRVAEPPRCVLAPIVRAASRRCPPTPASPRHAADSPSPSAEMPPAPRAPAIRRRRCAAARHSMSAPHFEPRVRHRVLCAIAPRPPTPRHMRCAAPSSLPRAAQAPRRRTLPSCLKPPPSPSPINTLLLPLPHPSFFPFSTAPLF